VARKLHEEAGLAFFECFINTPLEVCESRDPKGLYKKARRGEIKGFTGIDQSYEEPVNCELVIRSGEMSVDECVQSVISLLQQRVCQPVCLSVCLSVHCHCRCHSLSCVYFTLRYLRSCSSEQHLLFDALHVMLC